MSRETWTGDWRGGGAYKVPLTKSNAKELLTKWRTYFVQKDWEEIVDAISIFFDNHSSETLTLFLEKSPLQSLRDVKRKIFFAENEISVKKDIEKIKESIECHQVDSIKEPFSILDNKLATDIILESGKKVLCANGILLTHRVINEKIYRHFANGGMDFGKMEVNKSDIAHLSEFFDTEKLFAFLQKIKKEDYFFEEE